ncbi:MAG: hypothetical protein HUU34_19470 [Saprospiraceae bacterium]|jgi:hypothetical protein|nr:hypothetical protein [Saprospiraceae bacterium]
MEYIRQLVIHGQLEQGLEELIKIGRENKFAKQNDLLLLLTNYNNLQRESKLGLDDHSAKINGIIRTTFTYIDEMEIAFAGVLKPVETDKDTETRILDQLRQLSGKVELLLNFMGQMRNPLFENFRRSRLWNLLDGQSRNHLMTAVALENNETLDDFSPVVTEYGKALENELNVKIFLPFRELFLKDNPKFDRNQYMQSTYGDFKQILYAFLYKNEKLTLNQMVGMIYEGIHTHNDTPDKLFSPRTYFYQAVRLKNAVKFIQALDQLREAKIIKSARNFVYTRQETEEFKDWVFDVLMNMQPNNNGGKGL